MMTKQNELTGAELSAKLLEIEAIMLTIDMLKENETEYDSELIYSISSQITYAWQNDIETLGKIPIDGTKSKRQ